MLREIDARAIVRHSLETDLVKARAQRDILEKSRQPVWVAMVLDGKESRQAVETYQAAKLLSEALGFSYRPAGELAHRPVEDIVPRVAAIMDTRTPIVVETAVLGGEEVPKVKVSEAFKVYCDEIVADEIAGKSPARRKRWKKVKRRAVRLAPPQACDHFGQFDGEKGQHEAHHRHCGNQISPDVEGVGGGGGPDRSRPHHDHDTCARHEPGAPTPHSGHRPKYDGDNEGGGQCPEQIGGDAREIGH
jgi:hypothetical protein